MNSSTEHHETTRTEQLRSVYLSVTGDTEPMVESQQEASSSREIQTERASEAVGPAELHGLDDPGPSD